MPRTQHTSVELNYEEAGSGAPLVLVHGSWSNHTVWARVVPALAESHRVIAVDRRGCGQTPAASGTRRDQEEDLARLLETLPEKAVVVGTSFGGSIALGMASRRPELVEAVAVHEPPLVGLAEDSPELRAVADAVPAVCELIEAGRHEAAAELFVEEVALGPGSWKLLPAEMRAMMIGGAASFLDEQRDPEWGNVDVAALASMRCPVLLTRGTESPIWFAPIVDSLAEAIPGAETLTIEGAGHAPHATHPAEYIEAVSRFAASNSNALLAA